jgi:hypothetical protein
MLKVRDQLETLGRTAQDDKGSAKSLAFWREKARDFSKSRFTARSGLVRCDQIIGVSLVPQGNNFRLGQADVFGVLPLAAEAGVDRGRGAMRLGQDVRFQLRQHLPTPLA